MAGLKVVPVKALANGNLDLEDLKAKAEKHKDNLAAFMVSFNILSSYPNLIRCRSPILLPSVYSKTASKQYVSRLPLFQFLTIR